MPYAKKSLGQHFLRSKGALVKIVGAAKLSSSDTVLEVGPGEGVLTELLIQSAGKVIAVEKDDRLIPILQEKFATEIASGRLELLHADILDIDTKRFTLNATRFKLVANIPYYITGALIRKFLEAEAQPGMMVLLLQKEVARRIVAQDGKESILSISVKAYGTPKYIDTVKAGSFVPPPNVDSAIISIEGITKVFFKNIASYSSFVKGGAESFALKDSVEDLKSLPPEDGGTPFKKGRIREAEERFFEMLKKGFSHPRKLLSSNLALPAETLEACGIDRNARAETLSLDNWKCLAKKG